MKVLLIISDGMTPDALSEIPFAQKLMKKATYSMTAQTVMPSVTLPCYMSLFHSVEPLSTELQIMYICHMLDLLKAYLKCLQKTVKKCAFFYDWEELRDLSRPGSLAYSYYRSFKENGFEAADEKLANEAIRYISKENPDFTFLYLGDTDSAGHKYGWNSEEYALSMQKVWKKIERVIDSLCEDYNVIITSDHGGHGRMHGIDSPEEMTIPVIAIGSVFEAKEIAEEISIMDIAPTIAKMFEISSNVDWERKIIL